jgi:5-(aminomethyl)-3-furanmethanol phosphate kinase
VPKRVACIDSPVIIKLGGSLLGLADLVERIEFLLGQHHIRTPLIVVGGGNAADRVRVWQKQFELDDLQAHWLAIRAMSDNATMLARLWSGASLVRNRDEARLIWRCGRIPLLDTEHFLRDEESTTSQNSSSQAATSPGCSVSSPLPGTWDVSSDAISGWIAMRWPAPQLWLLKSCDALTGNVCDWSSRGLVDPCLPEIIDDSMQVSWFNLAKN